MFLAPAASPPPPCDQRKRPRRSPAEAFPKSLCLRLERSADREHDAVLRNLAGRVHEQVVTLADAGVDIGHAEVKRLPACRSAERTVAAAAGQAAQRTERKGGGSGKSGS